MSQLPFEPRSQEPAPPAGVVDRPSSTASPAFSAPAASPSSDLPGDLLFHGVDAEDLRLRWRDVQAAFVDEPQEAVKQADDLVNTVIQRLEAEFRSARTNLERAWAQDAQASTEDLRKALQRYRAFFNRLLSV